MVDKEIKEWLSKYKRLPTNEVQDFAISSTSNEKLINALFSLLDIIPGDVQHIDPVCRQLYDFYRSKEQRLQIFALQFVPALLWFYLSSLSKDNREVCGGVETFLLGVYNLEIVQADGTPVVETLRIPAMGRPSIYHDPRGSGLASEALTESALRILNRPHDVWKGGPHPQYESFNAQNRFSILTVVMQQYNHVVDAFHSSSHQVLCKATNNIVSSGFGNIKQPRIRVHSNLLVEMIVGIYYALFNGHQTVAVQAIKATHTRARYELFPEVLLMTNALLNSFQNGDLPKKRHEHDGLLTPSGSKKALGKKQSITNASFKAKKLPEDIEFTVEEDKLTTVDEDGEPSMAKNLKAKLMNIGGKLGGDRNKHRDGTPRRDSDAGSSSDVVDTVGVAVMKSNNSPAGGKVIVDVLEMAPIKGKKRMGSEKDKGIDDLENDVIKALDSYGGQPSGLGGGGDSGKSGKSSSASLVFSKKLGFTKSASASPTTSSVNNHSGGGNTETRSPKPSLVLPEAKHPVAPSIPAVISGQAINTSVSNGVNSISISSNNSVNSSSGFGGSSSTSSSSRKDDGIVGGSGPSNSDKRASSEGRVLDGVGTGMGQSSNSKDTNKQPRIHNSISDSNLPPSQSTSTTTRVYKSSVPHVNRNSYTTDL